MKLQYIGFIPLIVVVIAMHYIAFNDEDKFGLQGFAGGLVLVFWFMVTLFGFIWAIS